MHRALVITALIAFLSGTGSALAASGKPTVVFSRYEQAIPSRFLQNDGVDLTGLTVPRFPNRVFNIESFGAVPGGLVDNTKAINAAIVACNQAGGGHVVVPTGIWKTGPIELLSNVDFHVSRGAIVVFSPRFEDYPLRRLRSGKLVFRCTSPISAEEADNIAVTGEGVFDGSGHAWRHERKDLLPEEEWRELVRSGGVVSADGMEWWPSVQAMNSERYLIDLVNTQPGREDRAYTQKRQFLLPDLLTFARCRRVLVDGPSMENSVRFVIHVIDTEEVVIRNLRIHNSRSAKGSNGVVIRNSRRILAYQAHIDVPAEGFSIKSSVRFMRSPRRFACEDILFAESTILHGESGVGVGSETVAWVRRAAFRNLVLLDVENGIYLRSNEKRGGVATGLRFEGITMRGVRNTAVRIDAAFMQAHKEDTSLDGPSSAYGFGNIWMSAIQCDSGRHAVTISGNGARLLRRMTFSNALFQTERGIRLVDVESIAFSNVRLHIKSGPAYLVKNVGDVRIEGGAAEGVRETFMAVLDSASQDISVQGVDLKAFKNRVYLDASARQDAVQIR